MRFYNAIFPDDVAAFVRCSQLVGTGPQADQELSEFVSLCNLLGAVGFYRNDGQRIS